LRFSLLEVESEQTMALVSTSGVVQHCTAVARTVHDSRYFRVDLRVCLFFLCHSAAEEADMLTYHVLDELAMGRASTTVRASDGLLCTHMPR